MQFKKLTLSVIAASALIFGPAAIEATTSIELGTAAYAKGGNGGGGNSGGNGKSSKGSSVASSDAKSGNAWGKSKDKGLGNDRGSIASKLGALNAAHASANARLHASPNSRVGLIAAYEEQVLLSERYQQLQDDQEELSELAGDDDWTQEELDRLAEIASLYGLKLDPNDPDATLADLDTRLAEYETRSEATSAELAAKEIDLLSLASNKSLSVEVVNEVNQLLGITSDVAPEVESQLSPPTPDTVPAS